MSNKNTKWLTIVPKNSIILEVSMSGEPVAHQRPRYSKKSNRFYTPPKSVTHRKQLANLIASKLKEVASDKNLRYGVQANFYRSNRQRVDIDNLFKTILDAGTQSKIWMDDSQVLELCGRLYTKQDNPRTEILFYYVNEFGADRKEYAPVYCLYCGKLITSPQYPSSRRKYCNRECASKAKRTTFLCSQCGKTFEIPCSLVRKKKQASKTGKIFCSRQCCMNYFGNLKRINGSDRWRCVDCGKRVSRKEYKRCIACSMKERQKPTSNYWKLRHKVPETKNPQNALTI